MARRSTRQQIQSRRAQRQRQRQTRLIIGVTVIAVVLVAIIILLTRPRGVETAVETDYGDIPQSVVETDTGIGFALGDPDAPVTLTEFSDFSCTHCHDLADAIHLLVDDFVRDGELRIVFKPVAFVNPPYSRPAAQAAICAGNQGMFWEMHDQIWALYEANGVGAYTRAQLSNMAEAIGLDMDQFSECYASAETTEAVDSVLAEAEASGIQGTPTIFVDGQEVPYRGADVVYEDLRFVIENQLAVEES